MRLVLGFTTFFNMASQWPAIDRYYGPAGILPQASVHLLSRAPWRFSIVDHVGVHTTEGLYLLMLVALLMVGFGIWTRWSMILATFLLYSFNEYGLIALDGGDTTTRLLMFILMFAPSGRAFSVDNLLRRFRIAKETGKDQSADDRMMSIWPYRLLLWQISILYIACAILKFQGYTWRHGDAVSIVLHHDFFRRGSLELADFMTPITPILTAFTLIVQIAWVILIPLGILSICGLIRTKTFDTFKRALLLGGTLLHAGIAVFMDVGVFSFVMFTAYLGLLTDNDFRAMRTVLNRKFTRPHIVLFDGRCGFCNKAIILLRSLDWLHRIEFANLHDPEARKKYAPSVPLSELMEAMHVRKPDGELRKGFLGFRVLAGELPLTWFFQPFLFIPGMETVGNHVYAWVARNRSSLHG